MTYSLKPCPVCGSAAEIDFGGCSEISGQLWQTGAVDCTNDKCHMSVVIHFDPDVIEGGGGALAYIWNELQPNHRGVKR